MNRRSGAIGLGLLVLVGLALVVPASGAVSHLAIESATPSIEDPAPGERFSVSVTVANRQSGIGPVEVTDVYVRTAGRAREHARVEDMGTILPGESLTVPVGLSFDDPGTKRLTVHARVENESGEHRRVSYPLVITVEPPDEAVLSFESMDAVVGEPDDLTVTVATGTEGPISTARLELDGPAVQNPERVSAAIQAGTAVTHDYEVTFTEPGLQTVTGTLTYTTDGGKRRVIDRTVTVAVEPATVDPRLTATATRANGTSGIRVELAEFGNAQLRDVELKALVDGTVRARNTLPDVPAGESRSTVLSGQEIGAGNVSVIATYTAAGSSGETATSLEYTPTAPSSVALSAVGFSREDGTVTIDGDAANLGGSDVDAVLLAVADHPGIEPVDPNRDYFVGGIRRSEFGTFELTANVSRDVTAIPIELSYSADGQRYSRVVSVPYDAQAGADTTEEPERGLPIGLLALVGALVLLAAVGLYRWRR